MRINGWWLALGLLALVDHSYNARLEYDWVTIFNLLCIFIGFGMAFRHSQNTGKVTE